MSIAAQLKKVEEALATVTAAPAPAAVAPKVVELAQADVAGYIQGEIKKAAEDEGEETAKKRLEHLRKNVAALAKLNWESTERASVPMFEEPNLTAKTDESTKETQPAVITQPVASLASNEGATLGKTLEALQKTVDALIAAPAAVAPPVVANPDAGVWPADVNNPTFMKEGVTKRGGEGADAWGADPWASNR